MFHCNLYLSDRSETGTFWFWTPFSSRCKGAIHPGFLVFLEKRVSNVVLKNWTRWHRRPSFIIKNWQKNMKFSLFPTLIALMVWFRTRPGIRKWAVWKNSVATVLEFGLCFAKSWKKGETWRKNNQILIEIGCEAMGKGSTYICKEGVGWDLVRISLAPPSTEINVGTNERKWGGDRKR